MATAVYCLALFFVDLVYQRCNTVYKQQALECQIDQTFVSFLTDTKVINHYGCRNKQVKQASCQPGSDVISAIST